MKELEKNRTPQKRDISFFYAKLYENFKIPRIVCPLIFLRRIRKKICRLKKSEKKGKKEKKKKKKSKKKKKKKPTRCKAILPGFQPVRNNIISYKHENDSLLKSAD